jgi:hypothetical protein
MTPTTAAFSAKGRRIIAKPRTFRHRMAPADFIGAPPFAVPREPG